MKVLKIIKDQDFDNSAVLIPEIEFNLRKAARAVVLDTDNNVGLIKTDKLDYYKLPGGGLEKGEDIEVALFREVKEELGCDIKILKELGKTVEYRNKWKLKNVSFCYLAQVIGNKGVPQYTEEEDGRGFRVVWLPLSDAINSIKESSHIDYEANFITIRDLEVLIEASKYVN